MLTYILQPVFAYPLDGATLNKLRSQITPLVLDRLDGENTAHSARVYPISNINGISVNDRNLLTIMEPDWTKELAFDSLDYLTIPSFHKVTYPHSFCPSLSEYYEAIHHFFKDCQDYSAIRYMAIPKQQHTRCEDMRFGRYHVAHLILLGDTVKPVREHLRGELHRYLADRLA